MLYVHPSDVDLVCRALEESARRQGYTLLVPSLGYAQWSTSWKMERARPKEVVLG
jgi:hypothetical protein